jgi:NAD(P)-dependent dehydrogenase (short-subunit alcohol dehydrogenase family)
MSIPSSPRAVVTGGGGGLGRALCIELARRGAKIMIADRDLAGAERTAQEVILLGGHAEVTSCDVSDPNQIERLAIAADERFGGTDLLVNNAGVAVSGMTGDVPLEDWRWIFGINLWGVIYGCHVFAPRFKKQRKGHILNVASAAGLLCSPEIGPYNVTKAGVVALSETLCAELLPFGVGVSVLCPTFFKTNILASARSADQGSGFLGFAAKRSEDASLQAEDVARIALGACDRNELYAVPMADGKWAWRLKRLAPETFYRRVLPAVTKYVQGKRTH